LLAGEPGDDVRATDDRIRWTGRWTADAIAGDKPPSAWVLARCAELPAGTLLIDVASGAGRHSVPVAATGRSVIAVDFVEAAVAAAVHAHRDETPKLAGVVADASALPFRDATLGAILTVNFLDRSLFPHFARLLQPGGHLIVETYTTDHAALVASGRARAPRNPAYMLRPGELRALVAPLHVLLYDELLVADDAGERHVARVVAMNPES
jgi:SAM-dependent methyltransferase